MKEILTRISLLLLAYQSLSALDLHTDAACAPLKQAIETAQPIKKIKTVWTQVTASWAAKDQQHVLDQVIELAQTQKASLEKEVTALGDTTYDSSKLKWGSAQLAWSAWCMAALANTIHDISENTARKRQGRQQITLGDSPIHYPLFPFTLILIKIVPNALFSYVGGLLIDCVFPYLLYKGSSNLYRGLNHKKLLQQKIAHLEQTIQELQKIQYCK